MVTSTKAATSNDPNTHKVFCVAGYYLPPEQAVEMEAAWMGVLAEYRLPYFHVVDCAVQTGVFARLSKQECTDVATKMIGLIKQFTNEGIAIVTHADFFPADDGPIRVPSIAKLSPRANADLAAPRSAQPAHSPWP